MLEGLGSPRRPGPRRWPRCRVRQLGVADLPRPGGRRPGPGPGGGLVRRSGADRPPAGRPLGRDRRRRLPPGRLGLHRGPGHGNNSAARTSSSSAERTNRPIACLAVMGAGGGTRTPNLLFTRSTGYFPPGTAGVRSVPLSRYPRSSGCPLETAAFRPVPPCSVADRVATAPFAAVAVTAALHRARREPSKVATTRT
jgi:hypothetical protein